LVALGLAFFGEKLAEDERIAQNGLGVPPLLSWILFGVAALVFAVGIAPAPRSIATPTPRFFASLRAMSGGARLLFLGLLALSIISIGVAVPLFVALSATLDRTSQGWLINTSSWLLFIIALISFGLAWAVWERNVPSSSQEQASALPSPARSALQKALGGRSSLIIMGALFVLSLAFRLPGLDSAPPGLWFDEAQNGIVARNLFMPGALHPAFISDLTQMGALYFYVLGIVLKIFGSTAIWPLRLLPALGGALIAPMLYLIGTKLYGWRVGLVAGVLVAVGAWNITMSRFGMASLPTVAVDVAAYLCLVQALKTGRFGWWAGSGVLLGIALQMYYPSQLVPVVLLLVFIHRLISGRMAFFRAVRTGVVAFIVGLLIAATPITTFALQHTDLYTQRVGDVNIFSTIGSEGRSDALQTSIERHALMFNYAGDRNPRHNLPGAPMLDWITAALFLAGLGVLVLRVWRWQYFFPLVWFLLTISGGILSVVFEAPQGHRTLENSVVTPLIGAIFLGEVWAALDARVATAWSARRTRREHTPLPSTSPSPANGAAPAGALMAQAAPSRVGRSAIALAVILLLAWAGFTNVDRYFYKQVNDASVWMEMGGANEAVGKLLATYDTNTRVFVSPDRTNVPATLYLAPGKSAEIWPGSFALPFTQERDVAVLIDPTDEGDVSNIVRMYPHTQVTVITPPMSDLPQLFALHITKDDIASVRGSQRIDDSHVASTLKVAQYGIYSFGWQNADGSTGQTTGTPEVWMDGAKITLGQTMPVGAGLHSVVISGTQGTKVDLSNLLWAQGNPLMSPIASDFWFDPAKIAPHGLTALVRAGDNFDSVPQQIKIDPQVSFYFQITLLPRPYTVEWTGKLYAPIDGTYKFYTEQLSKSRLLIDGKEVVVNPTANNVVEGSITLDAGLHDIQLLYEDLDNFSHVYLYWQPPTINDKYIIPSLFLLPQLAGYPDTPAFGTWPTVDQADDTSWARSSLNPSAQAPEPAPPPDAGPQPQPQPQPPPNVTPYPGQTIVPSLVIGSKGDAALPLPRAVAADSQGNIYIYTETDSTISKYAPDGKKLASWQATGPDGKPTVEGSALVVKDDKLYFLDAASSGLITYDLDGKSEGSVKICACYSPRGFAFSNDGNLWTTDTGFGHIFKVDLKGQTIATMGEPGNAPGQFVEPASVWESPQGNLFVADVGNARMQSFTPDGTPLAQWPMGKGTSRDSYRITGTPDGDVLVTQFESRSIVEYDANGNRKNSWTYAPQGESLVPAGIAPYGANKYLVLFPFDNLAIIFDATQR
jgi:4-amino-4-deoxy-L-arabinose transferase-like glycosyltransferase/sugar lactone lactonase YvrE